MFCTRCGQPVGQTDRVCATCHNDLSRSGAIRLTDPATLGDASTGPPPEWFRSPQQVQREQPPSAPMHSPMPAAVAFPQQPQPPTVATWQPPPPPQPQVSYHNVDYVPNPEPGRARNGGVMLALTGLVVLAMVLVVVVAIRFLRPADKIVVVAPASSSAVPSSAAPASQSPSSDEPSSELSTEPASTDASATGAGMPDGVSACTPNVGAGRNTSCEFALNVAAEVDKVDPVTKASVFQVTAKSPVTGQSYTMSCTPRPDMTVCVGGNSASVYLLP